MTNIDNNRCTRVENPGEGVWDVFAKIPRGVKAFRKNCLGGSPYFGFYCIFINKFFKNLPGGVLSHPPHPPVCICWQQYSDCDEVFLIPIIIVIYFSSVRPRRRIQLQRGEGQGPEERRARGEEVAKGKHLRGRTEQAHLERAVQGIVKIQWKPLNGITLGQRETDTNNQMMLISELA